MKNLKEFIIEKFKLNSKNIKAEDIKYNKSNYKEALEILKNEAKRNNCKITFKNHPDGNTGDFTIFIYTPESKRYAVGFDGDWNETNGWSTFDSCYRQSLEWLEKYSK